MEHYTGLRKYVGEFLETSDERSLMLGRFTIKSNAGILIKINLKRIESDENNSESSIACSLIAADMDDIDTTESYYAHEFTTNKVDITELMKVIDIEFDKLLEILHEKIICCRHCGEIFGLSDTDYEMYGFHEACLCNDCGIQNIYDTKFSEEKCCICLESIGFGEFIAVCGDPRHKIHNGCGRKQHVCPLCKRGLVLEDILHQVEEDE